MRITRRGGRIAAVVALIFSVAAVPVRAENDIEISGGRDVNDPTFVIDSVSDYGPFNRIFIGEGGGTLGSNIVHATTSHSPGYGNYLVIKSSGANTLRLTGNNENYLGSVDLDAGILSIGNANSLIKNLENLHFNGIQNAALESSVAAVSDLVYDNLQIYNGEKITGAYNQLLEAIDSQRRKGSEEYNSALRELYGVGTLQIETGVDVVRDALTSEGNRSYSQGFMLNVGSGSKVGKGVAAFHVQNDASLTIKNAAAPVGVGGSVIRIKANELVSMTADGTGQYIFDNNQDTAIRNDGNLVLQSATFSNNLGGALGNYSTAFLTNVKFIDNADTAISNESSLILTDYSITGSTTGIYNERRLLLKTGAGKTSTIKGNTAGVLMSGGTVVIDGEGVNDMQDGITSTTYADVTATIDKYGAGVWKMGKTITAASNDDIDLTVRGGTLHLYRQNEVTGVTVGGIDFSAAAASSLNVTNNAVLSIGGGNAIAGNATIAASMVTFDMTGATTTDARLTLAGAVTFTPEVVNVANTGSLTDADYLLVQTAAGTLDGFTSKLYQNGVEYVPERSITPNAKMIGLKTNNDGSQLSLGTADATANTTVEWNPGATSVWDVASSANWKGTVNGMSVSTFLNRDKVNFTSANAGAVEVAASGVIIDTMNVHGDYSFSGGVISGDLTNAIAIGGGSTVTFGNQVNVAKIDAATTTDSVTFAPAADWTYNGIVSGSGNVVMDAAGKTMTLAGANTHTGSTTVNAGTLAISNAAGLDSSAKISVAENATLDFIANSNSAMKELQGAGVVEKSGTGDLSVETGNFSGVIQLDNSGSVFRKQSVGTFTFSGLGLGYGTLSLDAGTLALGDATWNGNVTTNASTATRINVTDASTINGKASLNNTTLALGDTLNVNGNAELDGATLDLNLTATDGKLAANSAVIMNNTNTLNITTWVDGEHLIVDSGTGITDNGTLAIKVNGANVGGRQTVTVDYRDSNKQMYLLTESTNYAFTWDNGSGNYIWDYSSANWTSLDTSDDTIIAGDKVIFEAQINRQELEVASGGVQVSEVSVSGQYDFHGGGISIVSNSVGNGVFRIENGSSVNFKNAANSFENGISVGTGGKLLFRSANQLGSGVLSFDSGDTEFIYTDTDYTTVANDITLSGVTTITVDTTYGVLSLSGEISGAGGIALNNGYLWLIGEKTYQGDTMVDGGYIIATDAKSFGTTGSVVITNDGTLDLDVSNFDSADVASLLNRVSLTQSELFFDSDSPMIVQDSLILGNADSSSIFDVRGKTELTNNANIDVKSAQFILNDGVSLSVTGGTSTIYSGDTVFLGAVTVEGDSVLAVDGSASFDTSSASLRLTAGTGQAPGQFHAVGGDINLSGSEDLNFAIEGATMDISGKTVLVADNAADLVDRLGSSLFRLAIQNGNEIFVEGVNSLQEVLEGMLEPGQLAGNIGSGAEHFDTVMLDSSTSSTLQAGMMDTFQTVTAIGDADRLVNALRQTFGEYAVEAVEAPRLTLDRFQSHITGRMAGQVTGTRIVRALDTASNEALASFASCDISLANRIWGGGFGVWADQNHRDNVAGYKYRAGGFILGYERIIDDRFTVGFAGAYTRGSTKSKGLATEYKSDNINIGLYAAYAHESNFYARAGVDFGYSWSDYDVSLIAGGQKSGDFESQTYSARLEIGYDWEPVPNTFFTPYTGITYAHIKQDDWQETGSANALTNWFDKSSMDVVDIPVGVRLSRIFPLGAGRYIAPEVHTAWIHSAGDKQASITTGYNGSGIANVLRGINPGRNRWQVGASVTARLTERLDASVDYTFQTRSGYKDHSVYLNMGVSF